MKDESIVKEIDRAAFDVRDVDVPCPKGFVRISLPFVGIYQSPLDSELDWCVEQKESWLNENGDEYDELDENGVLHVKVKWLEIYKDIAEYTAEQLNLKGEYGGCFTPTFFNYTDAHIYWLVNEKYAKKLCNKYGVDNYDDMLLALANDEENTDAFNFFGRDFEDINELATVIFENYADATELDDFVEFGEDDF